MELRPLAMPLVSNGFTLSAAPERLGLLVSSNQLQQPRSRLWEQFQAQGYLWFKSLLNRQEVIQFRKGCLAAFEKDHLSLIQPYPADDILAKKLLAEILHWASYEALCLSAPIRQFYEEVLGGPVLLHKRRMMCFAGLQDSQGSVGAHYDLPFLRAGTDRIYTCWIPLGDISIEMGAPLYLEGSDAWGRQMETEFTHLTAQLSPEERFNAYAHNLNGTGWLTQDLPALAERLGTRWLTADYEAGDVVIHSPYIVHTVAESYPAAPAQLHLSTEIHYQLAADPVDPRWQSDYPLPGN